MFYFEEMIIRNHLQRDTSLPHRELMVLPDCSWVCVWVKSTGQHRLCDRWKRSSAIHWLRNISGIDTYAWFQTPSKWPAHRLLYQVSHNGSDGSFIKIWFLSIFLNSQHHQNTINEESMNSGPEHWLSYCALLIAPWAIFMAVSEQRCLVKLTKALQLSIAVALQGGC